MREFKKLPLELFIGYDIEQNSRVIELDASEMVEQYPSGILQLVCKRPGEETTYIAPSFEQDGGTLRWTLTSYDVEKAGQGLAIVALVDTSEESVKVLASHKIRTGIEEGLHFRDAEKVDPEDSLIARVLAAVSQAQAYAQDAAEALGDVQDEHDQAIADIEAKGAETLASIPSDYTTLSGDVSDLKSAIQEATPLFFSGAGDQGAYIPNTLSVGDRITFTSNSYRRIYHTPIHDGDDVWVVNCADSGSNAYAWAIVDENETILKVPTFTAGNNDGFAVRIKAPANSAKLYWTVAKRKSLIIKDNGKYVLYSGSKHQGQPIVENGALTNGTERIDDEACYVADINNGGYINYSIPSNLYISAGIWIRCDYINASKLTKLDVSLMTGTSVKTTLTIPVDRLKAGEWIFAKRYFMSSSIDGIRVTPTITESGSSVRLMVSPFVVTDQFSRPIIVINFDQAWASTEAAGVYDALINNNIAFTITGMIPNDVSAATEGKLLAAYSSGLLDVGAYGNEHYDSTYYPINVSTDMPTAQSNMLNLLTIKHRMGIDPISFGPANHIITLDILRTIKDFNYKITRVFGASDGTNSMFQSTDFVCLSEGAASGNAYNLGIYSLTCGAYGMFAHEAPSFVDTITSIQNMIENGTFEAMNMKQFSEYIRKNYRI